MSDHALSLRLVPERDGSGVPADRAALIESYRRLADVFHDVLGEQSLDALLDRIADALAELVPHDSLTIYEADEPRRLLMPVWARDKWADKILADTVPFGVGLTGWGVEHREPVRVNQAHRDPRTATVAGTPADEPEAMVTIPLIARDSIKGALNIYRLGEDARFDDDDFELAKRFGDAAALALDNAQIRARLEHQAQTDSLTGLYNHRAFHERLRLALASASRSHQAVSVLMLDIDDFKRVNDVFGHGAGDEILRSLAETLKDAVRASDVVYRLGGEEFAVVIASRSPESAERLAHRLVERVEAAEFDPAGRITISVGLARGPEHAMNPRELIACAEAAMMTAKARGKNQIVLYDESSLERPDGLPVPSARDVRSVAHLKMLQSLGAKLNRLNDVREIGNVIATELRSLIDYHNCRVSIVEGDDVVPIAFVGMFTSETQEPLEILACKVGQGITGRVAQTGESLLIGDAANCEFARILPGTDAIDESQVVVPLTYGTRIVGVIVISKLGLDQFDEDDVRLLEVLAGHAAVALENAGLYEAARREAERATALLEFSRQLSSAEGMDEVVDRIVELSARTLGSPRASVWFQDGPSDGITMHASHGYSELDRGRLSRMHFDMRRRVRSSRAVSRSSCRKSSIRRSEAQRRSRPGDASRSPRSVLTAEGSVVSQSPRPRTQSSPTVICVCSPESPIRPSSRSRTRGTSAASRRRFSRRWRHLPIRSRRTTSTPRLTRAGSPTLRSGWARGWAWTGGRSSCSSSARSSTTSARSGSRKRSCPSPARSLPTSGSS